MLSQRLARTLAAVLLVAPVALGAQSAPVGSPPEPQVSALAAPPAAAAEPAAESPCCTVPARQVVELEILQTLNSKANTTRDSFAFRLAEPLTVNGRVVAPSGTPGVGEVVHAARARAGGKAGELILAARYLDLNGTRIPLRTLRYGRSQGVDNSAAVNIGGMIAAATIPGAALIGYLIAGGEVNVPAGSRVNAQIAAETVLAPIE